MGKILIVKDVSKLPGYNVNDKIAIYRGDQFPGVKEQAHIDNGLFELIDIPGKTHLELHAEASAVMPAVEEIDDAGVMKKVWLDENADTWKELTKEPVMSVNYSDGVFTHNIEKEILNTVVAPTKVQTDLAVRKAEIIALKELSEDIGK